MRTKSSHRTSRQSLPRLPETFGILDLIHHVPMPHVRTSHCVWEKHHRLLVEDLLRRHPEDRWIAVAGRDVGGDSTPIRVAVLSKVEAISEADAEGIELVVHGVERVLISEDPAADGYARGQVRPFKEHDLLGPGLGRRLDGLVQAAMELSLGARRAHVDLGDLLVDLPHRRALLYRISALLIQDPLERLAFLQEPRIAKQIDVLSMTMAQALQLMNRRRDRDLLMRP